MSPGDPLQILSAVRRFVDTEVRPVAATLEHDDTYPHALVARMRELGLFGALVPAAHGGLGLDVTTYARVIEEICRGFMSLAGVLNSHTMAALIVLQHGTEEQRSRWLPRFAAGQARGGLCLTEPHAGSDVQAIRTVARRSGDQYLIDGTKMFVTNGREGNTFALLALTDPKAQPRHRGMSCFIVAKGHPGLKVTKSISKLGYKGVDTAELVFEDFPVPAADLVGGVEGRGFGHVMSGLETGRINIAARAVGVAQAAYDDAVAATRGRPAAANALAGMATRLEAARLLTYWAAGMKDRAERCDLEAGMAKLFASETAQTLAVEALRLHGESGTLTAGNVERYYRDAPLMIIGEGTNEIQRTIIARQLVDRYGERGTALTSRDAEAEDRKQIVLAVRQFVDKELGPVAAEHEHAGRFPAAILAALADLGILGAVVPPPLGGLGLDAPTQAMVIEELARGWATIATTVADHGCAAAAIARFGAREMRERLVPAMTRGERLGALGHGDVSARRDGEAWVVSGTTGLVANAHRAAVFVLGARAGDARTLRLVIERDARGLCIGEIERTVGGRGLDPARLTLDGVRVSADAVLDDAGDTIGAVADLGAAATALGIAQAAFEAALRYSQQRTTFGKPICQHQAVQLKLADMATGITATRLLVSAAAERLQAGQPATATLALRQAAEVVGQVTLEAMRIHGGYGYTTEFPVERYYRDATRFLAGD